MIAVITVLDEETGKVYIKEQPMQPTSVFKDNKDMTYTYCWNFRYNFCEDVMLGGENETLA